MSSSSGGQPRTVDVPLTAPAPSVSYTLPPGVTFDVEAVYVEVDASGAGGDVTAELTISEQSGVVIAKKTQGATIPAATTGSATWALRLTDETTATPSGGGIQFDTWPQIGDWLAVETTNSTGSPFARGIELLDGSAGGIQMWALGGGPVNILGDTGVELEGLLSGGGRNTAIQLDSNISLAAGRFGVAGSVFISTPTGDIWLIFDGKVRFKSDVLGKDVFEIWNDGSIHGLAAVGAITWDLV